MNTDDVEYQGNISLGCDLFTYCRNEPINKSDPTGKVSGSAKGAWYRSVKFVAGVINVILTLMGISIGISKLRAMGKAERTQILNSIKKRLQTNAYTLAKKTIKKQV